MFLVGLSNYIMIVSILKMIINPFITTLGMESLIKLILFKVKGSGVKKVVIND